LGAKGSLGRGIPCDRLRSPVFVCIFDVYPNPKRVRGILSLVPRSRFGL